jgi:hypothetical protein
VETLPGGLGITLAQILRGSAPPWSLCGERR